MPKNKPKWREKAKEKRGQLCGQGGRKAFDSGRPDEYQDCPQSAPCPPVRLVAAYQGSVPAISEFSTAHALAQYCTCPSCLLQLSTAHACSTVVAVQSGTPLKCMSVPDIA
eukprot:856893-Rhodomonas_salina.1